MQFIFLDGREAKEFVVNSKMSLDHKYKDYEPVRWRERNGEYAGTGIVLGHADAGMTGLGDRWIVCIGRPLNGYYPYSCFLVFAIDLEPIHAGWDRQLDAG